MPVSPGTASKPITPGQQRILDAIIEFRSAYGRSPSHRELAQILGKYLYSVADSIDRLVEKGKLKKVSGNLVVVGQPTPTEQLWKLLVGLGGEIARLRREDPDGETLKNLQRILKESHDV